MDKTTRDIIRRQISLIKPYDSIEQADYTDALQWVDSGAELFRITKPDIPPKHLVAYFVPVDRAQNSMLLCDHLKAQLWIPPGGHVELDEDPRRTVIREADEELGVRAEYLEGFNQPLFITISSTTGLTPGHIDVSLWYLLHGSTTQPLRYDPGEFAGIAWYSFQEIMAGTPRAAGQYMRRFTSKLQHHLKTRSTELIQ